MDIIFDGRFPINLQVQRLITERIANNDYIEGLKIPTANELSEELGVNYHTVRRAITDLVGSLLRVMRGHGTYVVDGGLKKARSISKQLITGWELEQTIRTARACRIDEDEFVALVKSEYKKQLSEEE